MEIVVIAVLVLLFTLAIGVPVPFSLGAATIFLVYFGGYGVDSLIPVGYSKMNTVVLLAIPLFILSGGLMEKGRIADPLVNIAEIIFGRMRGGLGVAAVWPVRYSEPFQAVQRRRFPASVRSSFPNWRSVVTRRGIAQPCWPAVPHWDC